MALQKDVEFYGEIRSAIKKHAGEELDINVSAYAARRTPTESPNLSTTFPIHREPVASVATYLPSGHAQAFDALSVGSVGSASGSLTW